MLIPYPELAKRHSVKPIGVVHIGGSTGQERFFYANAGIKNVVWVEAIPAVFKQLKQNVSCYPDNIALNACISQNDNETVEFNISSNGGESSSVFDFHLHSQFHPDVTFIDKIQLKTTRVDSLFIKKGIDIRQYDYLSLDIQGSELNALKSMGDMLRHFKYCYVEVNKTPMYKDIPLVGEIDAYLSEYGFEPVDEKYTGAGWGDKFYIKKQNINSVFRQPVIRQREGIVNVPQKFMPLIRFSYPPDNHVIFEKWYLDTFNEATDRLCLPVQWTAFLVNNSFGEDKAAIKELQDYVDTLDRSKKYYTIHQFDLGCMVDFKDLDILVFGMAGGRIDYCLPLLCMPHNFNFNQPKTLLANFIGRRTHPIRDKVIEMVQNKQGVYVSEAKHDLSAYCSIIASSKFTLCPRGYSANSFRILEALQFGSIPVIITDELLEPHGVNPREYAIVIKESEIWILSYLEDWGDISLEVLQLNGKKYYEQLFTYPSNKSLILKKLKQ